MAYSTQRAVSDGTMAYLDLAIGYQSRTDIKVFYNDLPAAPETWAWVGTTDKRIEFTPNVPNGVEVLIQRTTRLDRIINVFAKGAKFTNVTMDMNFEQVLFLTQEAVEGSALSDIYNDVDFHNYKIKNLGTAVDPNDAITFGQVQTMSNGAYTAQLAAEAARTLAQAWAMHTPTTVDGVSFSAKQYAINAGVAQAFAAGSQNAAAASATASANSATASQTSRLASEAARDTAVTARDNALASATAADTSEANAAGSATAAATSADEAEYWVGLVAGGPVASIAGLTGVVSAADAKTALALPTDTVAALAGKEPAFAAGTTAQYRRGDKTWQTLNKAAVGLANVDNTSDAAKPVSTATQTALNGKENSLGYVPVRQSTGNTIQIGWSSPNMIASVDATFFGSTWPININGNAANSLHTNGQDRCNGWGYASGNFDRPYMRIDDAGIRYLLWQRTNDDTINSLRATGSPVYMEVNGSIGAYSVTMTPSDERLKSNIVDTEVDAVAVVRAMRLIAYEATRIGGGQVDIGFSAQNLQALVPGFVNAVYQDETSPLHDLGDVLNLNTTPIIATLARALQVAFDRIDALEAAQRKE